MFLSLKRICVMLSLQRREHGRQKRISTAPVSPSSVASRDEAESYSPKSSPRANLVQQMAPTVQTPRKRGTEKRVAPAAACPEHVSRLDRAADPPHATALGQTESRADRGPRDPTRTASLGPGQTDALVGDDQADSACPHAGGQTGLARLFSETLDDGEGHPACPRLDVSLSRSGSQGLCVSHAEPAHARMHSNHCRRQKQRHGDPALRAHLENPGNPAVFATRQRRRFLWWLQNPTRLRTIRPTVFVRGHRTDLLAHRRTRMQWRSRRIEWPVGACVLGAPTIWLARAGAARQPGICPVVYEGLCAAALGRRDTGASATGRTQAASDCCSAGRLAQSAADYRWPNPFHSKGQARWDDRHPQRNLESEQTLGRSVRVGDPHHALPPIGNLVSTFGST